MPKDVKRWTYSIKSNAPALDGQAGEFTSVSPSPSRTQGSDPRRPGWWTDDPTPEWAEGPHPGARTVSQWRSDFLGDFALRLDRCRAPRARVAGPGVEPARVPIFFFEVSRVELLDSRGYRRVRMGPALGAPGPAPDGGGRQCRQAAR
jgi:hypothetical protein